MEFFKENFRNKIKKTRESGRESFYVGLRFFLGLNFVKTFNEIGAIFPNEFIERQAVHDKFFIGQGNHTSDVFGKKRTDFITIGISNQKSMSFLMSPYDIRQTIFTPPSMYASQINSWSSLQRRTSFPSLAFNIKLTSKKFSK